MARRTGSKDPFNKHIDGVHGQSRTVESHSIEYLLTTLPIGDAVHDLATAIDALVYEKLEFSQLIQRDIDIKRVDKQIIDGYLKHSRNRVVFFPPLIVALVHITDGVPAETYPKSVFTEAPDYRDWGPAVL